MNKIAEESEFWMGKEDDESLKISRNFIDKMSWLIDLCIYNDNRVLDMGKGNKKGKKGKNQKDDEKEQKDTEFEILNLSEFKAEFDSTDMQVVTPDEIPEPQNQRLLKNLNGHAMALQIIRYGQLKSSQCKTAYLKVLEKAYIFLIRFVRGNKENSNTILEYIEDFYNDLHLGVHAIELIMEIFVDNENLITFEMTGLVKRLANVIQEIDFDQTKKSTLISFMPRFMEYNGNHIKTIQNLIL